MEKRYFGVMGMKPGKASLVILLAAMIVLAAGNAALANITASPSLIAVPTGQNTRVTITYRFFDGTSGTWGSGTLVTSSQGLFNSSSPPVVTYDTNSIPLSVTPGAGGKGTVQETVLIPSSVLSTAAQNGDLTINYQRTFAPLVGGGETITVPISITLSKTAGSLSLRRVDLYFLDSGSRRNEITVSRNTAGLKAYADIYVNGSGFLQGYWEVGGRRIENVNKYISFGSKATVSTSDVPGISTFTPGLHSISFVITDPVPGFSPPRIAYLVTSGVKQEVQALDSLTPGDRERITDKTGFTWTPGKSTAAYIVTFTRESDGKVALAALTSDEGYMIPAPLLESKFTSGIIYLWRVRGYDTDGELLSESKPRRMMIP